LIGTSACLGGEIPSAFMKRDAKTAKRIAETYLEIFGPDRFFMEVQKQGVKEQDEVNPELADLAKRLGIGLVATNDVHYLTREDHFAHDVLCCISMGRLISDEGRLKYPTEIYLKSPAEMQAALGNFDQAIENTTRIAAMCDVTLDFSKRYAPVYRVPKDKLRTTGAEAGLSKVNGQVSTVDDGTSTVSRASSSTIDNAQSAIIPQSTSAIQQSAVAPDDERYLRQLCEDGLIWRYGTTDVSPEIRQRLEKEVTVIAGKKFCSYFLIVWDFCNFARENNIPVGARGSGVGTMVGYLLGLCNVDPIQYGLLFERFMDPSRNEMPDIDIDICQEGRGRIIEYVRNKYGHVAQIITFGTLAARAVCKDVGRVLGVPLALTDQITKLIPALPGTTLDKALSQNPELSKLYNSDAQVKQIIDLGKRLEGLCRNAGCHAAGVIIADQPLDDVVPLYKDKDDNILTQFEGPIAEKVGLLKMDFLGLRTLTTLQRSIELVKQTRGVDIDIEKVDLADKSVFQLFCRGETKGVFQFESGGMQDLLMKMQPDRIEDLIAANALYRPGPMELIPTYCNRKHGREKVPQVHSLMDNILAETYGIMVYQEQVMQIFNQLGGIELANAYKLIKAISKKTVDVIAKFQPEFINGCTSKGIPKEKAQELFDLILKFGGYGFNKSHSTRYAIVAFQTAYMKAYFPVEYMAAVLTFEMGSTDKMVEYIEECRRLTLPDGSRGIRVLPPDVNVSAKDFTPVYGEPAVVSRPSAGKRGKKSEAPASPAREGTIRFGMMAVRGVGEKAVESIIEDRARSGAFRSLHDFCERIDLRAVTKGTIEALIKCGAFSSIATNRAALLAAMEGAVEGAARLQHDKRAGQMSMFGGPVASALAPSFPSTLPAVDDLPSQDLLKFEKELLGFYITSHPLTSQQHLLDRYTTATTKDAMQLADGSPVWIGGMINRVKKSVTKNGRSAGMQMAMITMEDLEGQIDGVIFAETFADIVSKYPTAVAPESIVMIRGAIDRRRETPSIRIDEVIPIKEAVGKLTTSIGVKIDRVRHSLAVISGLRDVMKKHAGKKELFVQIASEAGRKVSLRVNGELGIRISQGLVDDLETLLGNGTVELGGEGARRRKRLAQQALFKEEVEEVVEPVAGDAMPEELP